MIVSRRILKILAAIVWLTGGIVLGIKGVRLLRLAAEVQPTSLWPKLAVLSGLIAGGAKAWFFFSKFCRKNFNRIDSLESPRIWQFFRPGFFFFLALMIMTGVLLYKLALGSFVLLVGVGILDISLAVALLGSSIVFRFY